MNPAHVRRFGRLLISAATLTIVVLAALPVRAQTPLGPTPYLQFSDSPFSGLTFAEYFHLETFEDGLFNVPGVTSPEDPDVIGPDIDILTDSVDADDGAIDGLGRNGHSLFHLGGSLGLNFIFDANALGGLPTHMGIVWTDGLIEVAFEAFDAQDNLIAALGGTHPDGGVNGATGEDRFYGVIFAGGISRFHISNTEGGIEVDHLQYGRGVGVGGAAAPEPGTLALTAFGLTAFLASRRKQKKS